MPKERGGDIRLVLYVIGIFAAVKVFWEALVYCFPEKF